MLRFSVAILGKKELDRAFKGLDDALTDVIPILEKIANDFCMPWKNLLPSWVVKSNFKLSIYFLPISRLQVIISKKYLRLK